LLPVYFILVNKDYDNATPINILFYFISRVLTAIMSEAGGVERVGVFKIFG